MASNKDPFYHRGENGIPATARWQDYVAVTTATGGWKDLEFWYRHTGFRACDIISGNAADAGTLAHDLIRQFLAPGSGFMFRQPRYQGPIQGTWKGGVWQGQSILTNAIWRPAMRATESFQKFWWDAGDFDPIVIDGIPQLETVVWSDKWGIAGRQDAAVHYNVAPTMFDWKSSKDFYPNQAGELAARVFCWRECHPDIPIAQAAIVRLDKEHGEAPQLWWMDDNSGLYRKTKTGGLTYYFEWYLAHLADWRKAHPKVDGPALKVVSAA